MTQTFPPAEPENQLHDVYIWQLSHGVVIINLCILKISLRNINEMLFRLHLWKFISSRLLFYKISCKSYFVVNSEFHVNKLNEPIRQPVDKINKRNKVEYY